MTSASTAAAYDASRRLRRRRRSRGPRGPGRTRGRGYPLLVDERLGARFGAGQTTEDIIARAPMTTILQEAAAGRATIVPWTVERYHRAIETGSVPEDTSVELIDGFIVHKDRATAGEDPMTIGDRHRVAVLRLAQCAPDCERVGRALETQLGRATSKAAPDALGSGRRSCRRAARGSRLPGPGRVCGACPRSTQ